MYKRLMTALILTFAASPFTHAGITNIKEIANNTTGVVFVKNLDDANTIFTLRGGVTGNILANGVWSGEMWIPWAVNSGDFSSHHIRVTVTTPVANSSETRVTEFFIWQAGDFVRFNRERRFVENAPKVPGLARVNGERRLVVTERNSQISFRLEEYK